MAEDTRQAFILPLPLPPSSNCFQFENNLAVGHPLPPFPAPVGISAFVPKGWSDRALEHSRYHLTPIYPPSSAQPSFPYGIIPWSPYLGQILLYALRARCSSTL